MKHLQSPLFAAILGGLLFLLTSAFLTTKGISALPHGDTVARVHHEALITGPSWDFFNPEMDQIVADLKAERAAVALKEKQLQELAARLNVERAELDGELKKVTMLQQKVDREVFRIKEDEAGNLKKLSKMYGLMEPAGAARIFRELDDVVVVKILTLMKEPETAVILESFARLGDAETKRAAAISEHLRAAASTDLRSAKASTAGGAGSPK